MKIEKTLLVTSREKWRAWLQKHHETEKEIWLVYFKKHTGKPRIAYDHAVEEAICFGWIDSIVKRLDDEKFIQKFTPRKNNKQWSALNRRRVRLLAKTGLMTQAGLTKVTFSLDENAEEPKFDKRQWMLPDDLRKDLMAHSVVWNNFERLAPSQQRNYIGWIASAKKPETRQKRLEEAIGLLARNKKLGLK